jgi:N-hydroxyarylamine O-acetyltransferase
MKAAELDRYFARIDYRGSREPSLPVLHALTAAHTQHIPFENLDVLLGRRMELGFDALFDKLVRRGRGGYCFEQNGLFLEVLTTLGFDVTPLSARVRLERSRDFIPARTHLCLRVMLDGAPWLTDVGVGGASLTSAIRLEPDIEQATAHEARRIVHEEGRYFHQWRLGADWHDVYEFTGEAMPPIDREVGHWYTSTHPASHFKDRLIAARAAEHGRRYTLLNDTFKLRERDGHASQQRIESPEQLLALLDEHFGLHFDAGTRFGPSEAPWPR